MEADAWGSKRFRVLVFRNGQGIVTETFERLEAARIRFACAIDLCRARHDMHSHRVELWLGHGLLNAWPGRPGSL